MNPIELHIESNVDGSYLLMVTLVGKNHETWMSESLGKDEFTELLIRVSSQFSLLGKLTPSAVRMFLRDEQQHVMKIRV